MDHLLLPQNPRLPPTKVPLVCEPYDNGDFLTYPLRAGWHHAVRGDARYAFAYREKINPSDDRELEKFLQCWLFFGLLHELGGNQNDFKENGLVHSRGLEALLDAYTPTERICQVLDEVELILFCLHVDRDGLVDRRPGFNPAIRMSIVSLYAAVVAMTTLRYKARSAQDGMFAAVSTGLCPVLDKRERSEMPSVAYLWYIRHLEGDGLDHTKCVDVCQYATSGPGYRPMHRLGCVVEVVAEVDEAEGCSRDTSVAVHDGQQRYNDEVPSTRAAGEMLSACMMAGPDPEHVKDILRLGSYPVLREDLQVRPADVSYVAISHVWAEGLGHRILELPKCQIDHIWTLIHALEGRTFEFGTRTVLGKLHLWIDTLLVPQRDALHPVAMARMADVYKKAACVLVLDRSLQRVNRPNDMEALVPLHISQWSGRLWTLQEAQLPPKVLIQFADQAVDFAELHAAASKAYREVMTRSIAQPIVLKDGFLRARTMMQDMSLVGVLSAMATRQGKLIEDQPICAAALLDVDISKVVVGTMEERMVALWRMVEVPSTIVYNTMERLKVPGFGWAPASFSGLDRLAFGGERMGVLKEGLEICVPAWRIRRVGDSEMARAMFDREDFNIRHEGQWYACRGGWQKSDDLLLHNEYSPWLLGSGEPFTGALVDVQPVIPSGNVLAETGYRYAQEIAAKYAPSMAERTMWPSQELWMEHLKVLEAEVELKVEQAQREVSVAWARYAQVGGLSADAVKQYMQEVYFGRYAVVEEVWEELTIVVDGLR